MTSSDPAIRLAAYIPSLQGVLNTVCLMLRADHHALLVRTGAAAEDVLASGGLTSWQFGTNAYAYIAEVIARNEDGPLSHNVFNHLITITTPDLDTITVTRAVMTEDEIDDAAELPFRTPDVSPPPDWQLITTPRWPERDRLIVPPQTRTLANNGWCSPSERALATPAVDPNEPLAIMDYLERAILVDRSCASRKMPVFDRKVAMGHRERLLECPLDAKGHAWAVNA